MPMNMHLPINKTLAKQTTSILRTAWLWPLGCHSQKRKYFLGQCGITLQPLNETYVPEIEYIFSQKYWHDDYAIESAHACKEHAFFILGFSNVYSIIRENNLSSIRIAPKNGMQEITRIIKFYYQTEMPHIVYKVSHSL